uniref:ARAD1C15224p n=1 Tax=Blastobotrys adeninivorans TaxID=409370 RepID=A0A060T0S2_BLAAD
MNFASQLNQAVTRQDGTAAAKLLSITHADLSEFAHSTNAAMVTQTLGTKIKDPQWAEIAVAHWLVAVQVVIKQDLKEAYAAQNALLMSTNRAAEKTDNWILPVLYTVAKELRHLSILADKSAQNTSDKLEEATRTINRAFTLCLNDRNPVMDTSKKWGTYYFVGELFKIYFRLDKRPLAKSALKVLQSMTKDLPPLEEYPKSHQVTYLYYWGVLMFIDEDYLVAEEKLERALQLCHKKAHKNQEQILLYLLPIKVLKGFAVSKQVWKKFPRLAALYKDILCAHKQGHFKRFDDAVEERRTVLVKKYVYLTMERLKLRTAYNLIKWTHDQSKTTRLSVALLRDLFNLSGFWTAQDSDDHKDKNHQQEDRMDEIEGIIATLISSGKIKGYISHERRTVVLSNKDPFPSQSQAH